MTPSPLPMYGLTQSTGSVACAPVAASRRRANRPQHPAKEAKGEIGKMDLERAAGMERSRWVQMVCAELDLAANPNRQSNVQLNPAQGRVQSRGFTGCGKGG